ncbi:helix-turn-helix transcriptional regulator [Burkholderia vietnamiensis]|uniref:helix-turn-helix transcriptional regulator n=1 Tax=Burkholderia vietnamiensis TaxID=60552 RepID=UPI002653F47C|nr:LuxR C-terminal-related transcriptional regulator [Burkholderia vietnamiensis]MDN7666764.1 LuxR C-terminal-related transcriptional regulator [Burkholderia vietnamiensis]
MEFSRLFAHVGEAISSSGSRRFPRMMYSLISAAVPVDEIRISEFSVDAAPAGELAMRSLGAAPDKTGAAGAGHEAQMPPQASERRVYVDDTPAGLGAAPALVERIVALLSANASPHGRQFHLVSRKRTHCYVISLHRAETADDFSPQEQDFIKELSHVLFPIVASHATALGSAPPSPARLAAVVPPATESGRERVARRFAERLRHAGVTLSAREIDACTALLAGDTVAAIAMRLALRESTVETYLKRAAVKLGFGGRHGLTRWMLDETAGGATEAGLERAGGACRDCGASRLGT